MIELNKKRQEIKNKQGKQVTKDQKNSQTQATQATTSKSLSMKDKWTTNCYISNLNFPSLIPKESLIKKRKYQIKFVYVDE